MMTMMMMIRIIRIIIRIMKIRKLGRTNFFYQKRKILAFETSNAILL